MGKTMKQDKKNNSKNEREKLRNMKKIFGGKKKYIKPKEKKKKNI